MNFDLPPSLGGSNPTPAPPPIFNSQLPRKVITEEEKNWAMLAHLSSLLSLISGGFLGPIASFIIWLVYREKSVYIAQQSLQSTLFQVGGFLVNWMIWIVVSVLSSFLIGLCLIPFALLITVATIVWPLLGAYNCSQGKQFRYPIVADMVSIPGKAGDG